MTFLTRMPAGIAAGAGTGMAVTEAVCVSETLMVVLTVEVAESERGPHYRGWAIAASAVRDQSGGRRRRRSESIASTLAAIIRAIGAAAASTMKMPVEVELLP